MTTPSQHPTTLHVQEVLGPSSIVVEFEESTHTAADAAAGFGCDMAQIAKSILLRATVSGKPMMVVKSGRNRVDEKEVRALLGEKIERADALFVREMTGFEVGGVPPVAHAQAVTVFIDQNLATFPILSAAGGTPNTVFEIGFDALVTSSRATIAELAKV